MLKTKKHRRCSLAHVNEQVIAWRQQLFDNVRDHHGEARQGKEEEESNGASRMIPDGVDNAAKQARNQEEQANEKYDAAARRGHVDVDNVPAGQHVCDM